KGPDVILDMVGGDYIDRDIEALALDGRIAQIASRRPQAQINLALLRRKRVTLSGSSLRPQPLHMKADIARSLEEKVLPILAEGRVRPIVDSTFPLERVADAHARMDSGDHVGKIVLVMAAGGNA